MISLNNDISIMKRMQMDCVLALKGVLQNKGKQTFV